MGVGDQTGERTRPARAPATTDGAGVEYFLAWRDGLPVGRITAHVDDRLTEFQNNRWGLFGFYESENDPAVAVALLAAAESCPTDRGDMLPAIDELADRLEPEHGIRLRRMRRRNLRSEVRAFMEVYNLAWSSNWGFVPLTDAELDHMAKELGPVLDEDFACVAETAGGEVAGVSLTLPDWLLEPDAEPGYPGSVA